jgi:hypothetical protein
MGILDDFKSEKYRIGDLQVLPYHRHDPFWGESYLSDLYFALGAGRRSSFRRENLQMLLCGTSDLSLPSVLSFFAKQNLVVMGKWENGVFRTAGACWVGQVAGTKEKSGFGAYAFLRWSWGTYDQQVMVMLGVAYLFNELDLCYIHAQRYADNHVSKRFLDKIGFKDVGVVPKLLPRNDALIDGVVSSLSREDFERNCMQRILAESV